MRIVNSLYFFVAKLKPFAYSADRFLNYFVFEECIPMFRFLSSWMNQADRNRKCKSQQVLLGVQELEERRVMSYANPLIPTGVPTSLTAVFTPQAGLDANTTLVKGLYESILNRPVDPTGLVSWVHELNSGATAANVAYDLVNSTEARIKEVDTFFKDIFNRAPTAAELQKWVTSLQGGLNELVMLETLLDSTEFSAPLNNTQFVTALYEILLNRAPDQAGLAVLVAQLNASTETRAQLVEDMMSFPEFLNTLVTTEYETYLQQVPSSSAVATFVSQMQSGSLTNAQFVASLLGSQLYDDYAITNE